MVVHNTKAKNTATANLHSVFLANKQRLEHNPHFEFVEVENQYVDTKPGQPMDRGTANLPGWKVCSFCTVSVYKFTFVDYLVDYHCRISI